MPVTKRKPAATRIKNYTTIIEAEKSISLIMQTLARRKARQQSLDYDDQDRATALQFTLEIRGRTFAFRLPVRIDQVEAKVLQSYPDRTQLTETLKEQAYRTAWAIIKDWVLAQMALIDANMVRTEEVFLPYLVNSEGKTYFETFSEQLALPRPGGVIITEN